MTANIPRRSPRRSVVPLSDGTREIGLLICGDRKFRAVFFDRDAERVLGTFPRLRDAVAAFARARRAA